jgi:hypothetical protein
MEVRPFPARRDSGPNNFIGSVVKENSSLQIECPGVNVINPFSLSPMVFSGKFTRRAIIEKYLSGSPLLGWLLWLVL